MKLFPVFLVALSCALSSVAQGQTEDVLWQAKTNQTVVKIGDCPNGFCSTQTPYDQPGHNTTHVTAWVLNGAYCPKRVKCECVMQYLVTATVYTTRDGPRGGGRLGWSLLGESGSQVYTPFDVTGGGPIKQWVAGGAKTIKNKKVFDVAAGEARVLYLLTYELGITSDSLNGSGWRAQLRGSCQCAEQ